MLKKYCVAILCFFVVIGVLFLSQFTSTISPPKGQKVVYGTVLEVYDTYLLIEPGEEIRKMGSEIKVSLDVVSKEGAPDVRQGDKVRVIYSGISKFEKPPSLEAVFLIENYSEKEVGN